MSTFLSKLQWRHAARAFDSARVVPENELTQILEAVRMAPTSFGLQPFHVYVVRDQPTKDRLCAAGWNQPQFKTASHVLCFVALNDIGARIDEFMALMSGGNAEARAQLKGYEDMMRGSVGKFGPVDAQRWADKQAYIALGFAMAACAELGVDSCPMEGFVPAQVNQVLGLPEGRHISVMLPIGYRTGDAVVRPKVRFPASELFTK